MRITLIVCLASVAACGGKSANSPRPKSEITQTLPLEQLYLLEAGGIAPADTSVTFKTGQSRTVIMRHPAPDNGVFADVHPFILQLNIVAPLLLFSASAPVRERFAHVFPPAMASATREGVVAHIEASALAALARRNRKPGAPVVPSQRSRR